MEYKHFLDYAIRTIKIYKEQDEIEDYEFTRLTGAILNILSAVYPDNKFLIDLTVKMPDELPYIEKTEKGYIEEYFINIRNGLAHKTETNFKALIKNTGEIVEIQIQSNGRAPVRLEYSDFLKIFYWLENKIKNMYE